MQRVIYYFSRVFLLLILSQWAFAQQDNFLKDFAERWETSRQYMIMVAEAMPEKEFTFKPTPEEMSFAEQLMHIAVIIDWHAFSNVDGQGFQPRWEEAKCMVNCSESSLA